MKAKILSLISKLLKLLKNPLTTQISILVLGITSTAWFLIRVIPKPQRATYPCMQASAPLMSGFVIWLMSLAASSLAFKKAKQRFTETRYVAALLFLVAGIGAAFLMTSKSPVEAKPSSEALKIWYKPNLPLGEAKGMFPGRVTWGHNPKIASWDGKTGMWWEDRFNNQEETNKLLSQTL